MSDTKDSVTDKLAPENDDDFVDDSTWTPPTEEELKRMEERRKKQDAISKDLGQYLLKGWKMLATYCPNKDCGTVLMQDKEGRDYCVACKMFLKKEEEKKEEAKPATTPVEPAKEKGIQLAQASKDADGGNSSGGEAKTKEPIFKPSFHNYKGKRSGNNKRGGRKAAGAAIPSQEEDDDILDGAPGKREQHFGTPSAKRARHTDGDVALPAAENPQQRHTVAAPRPKVVTVAKPFQNTHFNTTIIALEQKIELLSAELAKASDDQVIKLCQVIQEAAKTVETLVRVKSQFQ